MVSPPERRRCVAYLSNEHEISEGRACQAMELRLSSYRCICHQELVDEGYRACSGPVTTVAVLRGYRMLYDLLRGEECPISRERVRLIRSRERLRVVEKRCK